MGWDEFGRAIDELELQVKAAYGSETQHLLTQAKCVSNPTVSSESRKTTPFLTRANACRNLMPLMRTRPLPVVLVESPDWRCRETNHFRDPVQSSRPD